MLDLITIMNVVLMPILGSIFILFIPANLSYFIRYIALMFSLFTVYIVFSIIILFDKTCTGFQFLEVYTWGFDSNYYQIVLGLDGISIFFVLLTVALFPLCILASWTTIQKQVKEYYIAFLMMESLLVLVFCTLDLLWFYIFFESVLIPMFIIIGVWGSRDRKIRAAYRLFLYTLFGSVFMLLAILVIYFQVGTTDYQILTTVVFNEEYQKFLWLAFFASFAIKVPMLPFHIWLPEAHVEAPTAGSVILAGVLLKMGTYGFVRFSVPLFPFATTYFTPLVYTLSVIAIIYTSLTAIRQTDLKRIIAYASIAHMNLTLVGLFSMTIQGIEGSILQMLSHGIVASALFLCVGVIYDRHHSRFIKYYSGLVYSMPKYAIIFLIFTLANIAIPGTSSFVGEFLIFVGAFQKNTFITVISATGLVLGGIYSLWLYNRVIFGTLNIRFIGQFEDINRRELFIFLPLIFSSLFMGIYPDFFLDFLHLSVKNLI